MELANETFLLSYLSLNILGLGKTGDYCNAFIDLTSPRLLISLVTTFDPIPKDPRPVSTSLGPAPAPFIPAHNYMNMKRKERVYISLHSTIIF